MMTTMSMAARPPLGNDVRLHREVLGGPEPIELCRRSLVARFHALPEFALVVPAREGRRILLRLVLEDRLDLETKLFLRERNEPRRLVHRPFLPRAAVQPYIGQPMTSARRLRRVRPEPGLRALWRRRSLFRAVGLGDLRQRAIDRFLTHTMRAVRIGEITRDEDVLRSHLLQNPANDRHVLRTDRILAHLPGLVERQVQESSGAPIEADDLDAADRFRLTDDALDVLNLRDVHLAGLLV